MSSALRYDGKHQKNSRSAQRITPTHNLYTESSYISQIIAHQQKISDIPSSNKRLLNNMSPVSINYKEGKILQKNYIQNKYSLLLEGNQISRVGWKRYLLDGFKEKIEKLVLQNKKAPKLFRIKRQYLTKSVALQVSTVQDEYFTVNELIKRQDPSFDIDVVQDNLIQQHKQYLLKANNTDYDEKLLSLVKQFEIIVDRIEKEAFKVKIPSNHITAMQNYNDFYNVCLNQVVTQKTPRIMDFSKFDFKQRFKQSYAENFWKEEEADYEIEQQVQTCRVSTQRECQEEILEEIRKYQSTQPLVEMDAISIETQEIILPNENCQNKQIYSIEEPIQQQKPEKQVKKKKNVRYRNKKNSIAHLPTDVAKKTSQESHEQAELFEDFLSSNLQKHPFLDYMLSLHDIYDADLDQFREKQKAEYDSYIFCDQEDENIYQNQADWTCQLDCLLKNID